ncbi:conserved hypothetical protein [Ricinus communis]|uniref:Uncharacterized protein n=1 Tax=Ricinus communis TaxID=3988 RepID=B9S083_RICCO|nr:conserved hypothetical protein [Ricinus communis]
MNYLEHFVVIREEYNTSLLAQPATHQAFRYEPISVNLDWVPHSKRAYHPFSQSVDQFLHRSRSSHQLGAHYSQLNTVPWAEVEIFLWGQPADWVALGNNEALVVALALEKHFGRGP